MGYRKIIYTLRHRYICIFSEKNDFHLTDRILVSKDRKKNGGMIIKPMVNDPNRFLGLLDPRKAF